MVVVSLTNNARKRLLWQMKIMTATVLLTQIITVIINVVIKLSTQPISENFKPTTKKEQENLELYV